MIIELKSPILTVPTPRPSAKVTNFREVTPFTAQVTLERARSIRPRFSSRTALTIPSTLRSTSDGGIVWSQNRPPLYVFDSKGALIEAIARRGSGPGEIGFIDVFDIASDGTI